MRNRKPAEAHLLRLVGNASQARDGKSERDSESCEQRQCGQPTDHRHGERHCVGGLWLLGDDVGLRRLPWLLGAGLWPRGWASRPPLSCR